MTFGNSIESGRFKRFFLAILISIFIHFLILSFGYIILMHRDFSDKEIPEPLSVQLTIIKEEINSSSELSPHDSNEPKIIKPYALQPLPDTDIDKENITEESPPHINEKQESGQTLNDAADYSEIIVPPWEIDVPPFLSIPGTIGVEKDTTPLLDALPLIASIYLDETGTPFLILYDPMPDNEALQRLNRFFTSSVFSPAMVQNEPVPSLLNLPLSVKGLSQK